MEPLPSSSSVIVETVAQASGMDIFETGGQSLSEARDAMVVTSEAGDTVVVTTSEAGDGNTVVLGTSETGDTVVLGTSETGDTVVLETSETGDTVVVTSEAGDTIDVTAEHAMAKTGYGQSVAEAVISQAGDTVVLATNEAGDTVVVTTCEVGDGMVFATTEAGETVVVATSEAVDTAGVTGETRGTVIGYKVTGTEPTEVPANVTDGMTAAEGGPEVDAAVNQPLLDVLNLARHIPGGGVVDGATDQMPEGNTTEGERAAQAQQMTEQDVLPVDEAQVNSLGETQTENDPAKATTVGEQPQDPTAEDEEAEEIIFVCIHGQSFRCKPQAGTRVRATKKDPEPVVDACSCSKSEEHPEEAAVAQGNDRKVRTRNQKFTCDKCGGRFTQKASLDRHMTAHQGDEDGSEKVAAVGKTDKAEPKSKDTSENIVSRRAGLRKRKIEAKSCPDRSCPDCGKVFSRIKALETHIKQHKTEPKAKKSKKKADGVFSTKNQFKCTTCEMVLESKYKLRRHRQEHTRTDQPENLQCNICSKVFPRLHSLRRHEISHEEKEAKPAKVPETLTCKECSKVFSQKYHLVRHKKIHEKGKLIKCAFCPETFEDRFTYKNHKKAHANERYYRDMQCEVCQKIVKGPATLKRHMRTHTNEKPYPCRIGCKSFFSSTSYRLNHERMHCPAGDDFLCTQCGEVLGNRSKLITHETKYHHGGLNEHGNVLKRQEFPCRHCGKIFYFRAVRKRHERIHTNEKPYMCQYCPKTFGHSNALLCHERVHTKERPYKCTVCSKTFSQATHLTTHMRVHTKEKPYQCRYCAQAFSHTGTRKHHERSHRDIVDPVLLEISQANPQLTGLAPPGHQQVFIQNQDIPNGNPEGTYQAMADPGLEEVIHQELPEGAQEEAAEGEPEGEPEGTPDSGMQEETQRIIVSHPEHEVQAADVILQLLSSGRRVANLDGLVHIVQSQ